MSPPVLTATVSTNDSSGYTLQNSIVTPFQTSGGTMLNGGIQPLVTTGNINNPPTWGPAFNGLTAQTVGSNAGPSGATGDVWQQGWQFNPPANQPGGVYNGTIAITAIGG